DAWNNGGGAHLAAALYTPDSVLVGATIAEGRSAIETQLRMLFQAGWTKVGIKGVNARIVGEGVLAPSKIPPWGRGGNDGKTLSSKSSHVLTEIDGVWLSAMHTAA